MFNTAEDNVWADTRVWPDLLILSPPGVTHLLPHRPDNGFGLWFVDLDRWIAHLKTWRPRVGPRLSQTHLQHLVDYFQLTRAESAPPPPPSEPAPAPRPDPSPSLDLAADPGPLQHQLAQLNRTVEDLARRVAALEEALQQTSRLLAATGESPTTRDV